jgi:hypothetical protein
MFTVEEPTQGSLLTQEAASVAEKTICIVVRKGRFGTKRKASTDDVEVESDKALLRLSKTILESPELDQVKKLDSAMTSYLKGLCLRSMFKGGVYLLSLGLVEEVNAQLETFSAERALLVDKAVETYDKRCEETSKRLDMLHDPGDYPAASRFRSKFYLEWQFVTWSTPTKLKEIKPALFEMERQKAAAKLSAVADDCRNAMRLGMSKLVSHMVDRLTPDPSGKKKKFHKSIVNNFNEFFRTFELRNVTDDAALSAVVAQARAAMDGIDVAMLKKDDAVRTSIAQQFEALQKQLEPMTVEIGTREIDLDDEDDDEDGTQE